MTKSRIQQHNLLLLSVGATSSSSLFPSSPRTLPWTPTAEIATQSASLKRKLNPSALAFFPSKQRKGDDSSPKVVSPSSNQSTAPTPTTTSTTTISSTSRAVSVASPSLTTPAGVASVPTTLIEEEGSSSASFSRILASPLLPPTLLPGSTPIVEPFSPVLTSGSESCSTTPFSLPTLPPAPKLALSTPVSLPASLSSSSSLSRSGQTSQPAPLLAAHSSLVSSLAPHPATRPKEFVRPKAKSRYSPTSYLSYQAQSSSSYSLPASLPALPPASHTAVLTSSSSSVSFPASLAPLPPVADS